MAAEARAWGAWGFIRDVGNSEQNLTAAEWRGWGAHMGLVGAYGMYPKAGAVSAPGGQAGGKAHLSAALAAEMPPGLLLACDAEGAGSAEAWEAYERGWLSSQTESPFVSTCYDGVVEASEVPPAAKDGMGFRLWWTAMAWGAKPPTAGYALAQVKDNIRIGSQVYDINEVQVDGVLVMAVDDAWTSPVNLPAPAPPPAPSTNVKPRFTFSHAAGESVGARHARCWLDVLADGPMGHTERGDWYASFIDVGQGAQHIESWSTSCAIAQHASLSWCGDSLGKSANGSGIFEEVGAGETHKAWQKNDE